MNPRTTYFQSLAQSSPVSVQNSVLNPLKKKKEIDFSKYTSSNDLYSSSSTTPKPSPSPAKTQYINSLAGTQGTNTNLAGIQSGLSGINDTLTRYQQENAPQNKYANAMNDYIKSLMPDDNDDLYAQRTKLLGDTAKTQDQYGRDIAEVGRLGAGAVAGNMSTGTNVVGSGNAAIASQSASQRISALTDAQRTNLLGAQFQDDILTNELERRTSQRSDRSEALRTRAEYEKSLIPEPEEPEAFSLSEGQSRFVLNPQTGKYEEVASKGKTYAPSSSGGGSGYAGGGDGTLSPLAQAVQNGTIALDKIPIAQRAQIAAELATSGIASKRQQQIAGDLAVVDSLLAMDTDAITGVGQNPLNYLGAANAATINTYNQLKGILSLENRQLLQGSGAISDFEFRVLSDAATALGRNLPNAEFRKQLQSVRDVLAGKYAHTRAGSNLPSTPPGNPQNVVTAPDGTLIEIID